MSCDSIVIIPDFATRSLPSVLPTATARHRGLRKRTAGAILENMNATTDSPVQSKLTIAGRQLALLDRARIYVCGITPYDVTHLGHAST